MLGEVGALCLNGLREKPARAAARAAAPHFYTLRAQRRRLRNQQPGAGRREGRRARPHRLRDRLRAVSHRVRCLGRAEACDGRGGDESESASGDSREAQLLERSSEGVKKEVKGPRFFKSVLEIQQCLLSYASVISSLLREAQGTGERWPIATRIERLFRSKGILQDDFTSLYREAACLAATIDDMVLRDKINMFRSAAAERLIRRLCGIELALRPVTSAVTLNFALWEAAAELEGPTDDLAVNAVGMLARAEAQKRARNIARLKRILKKCRKPYGRYFQILVSQVHDGCGDFQFDGDMLLSVCRELDTWGQAHAGASDDQLPLREWELQKRAKKHRSAAVLAKKFGMSVQTVRAHGLRAFDHGRRGWMRRVKEPPPPSGKELRAEAAREWRKLASDVARESAALVRTYGPGSILKTGWRLPSGRKSANAASAAIRRAVWATFGQFRRSRNEHGTLQDSDEALDALVYGKEANGCARRDHLHETAANKEYDLLDQRILGPKYAGCQIPEYLGPILGPMREARDATEDSDTVIDSDDEAVRR